MLFGRMKSGVKIFGAMLCILVSSIMLSACVFPKGSILILENRDGFTAQLFAYSLFEKCEMALESGSEVQIEIRCERGEFSLTIDGKRGSRPYTGNNLQSGVFTVTVSETDEYLFKISGKKATGRITVKNLGIKEENNRQNGSRSADFIL